MLVHKEMPSLEIQMNQEQCNMTFIVLLAAWLPSSVKEDVKNYRS